MDDDATDIVIAITAVKSNGHALASSDFIGQLAAIGFLKHRCVIAVVKGGSCVVVAAAEGAAATTIRCGYADIRRGEEAVPEVDRVLVLFS